MFLWISIFMVAFASTLILCAFLSRGLFRSPHHAGIEDLEQMAALSGRRHERQPNVRAFATRDGN